MRITLAALLLLQIDVDVVGAQQATNFIVVDGDDDDDDGGGDETETATYYHDRFNYDVTRERSDGYTDYAPKYWNKIKCDEKSSLDSCLAYVDKWETGRDWDITKNYCLWCPDVDGEDPEENCDTNRHHQSPINLRRVVGHEPSWYEPLANECIDVHWMKYEDSYCTMEQLIDTDSFSIERHSLRIAQPIVTYEYLTEEEVPHNFQNEADLYPTQNDPGVRLQCTKDRGEEGHISRFGRIDFSKGFSQWWYLSHTDLHVPSEHTQDGVRYDAEIQLHHFYSVNTTAAETAAVAAAALLSPTAIPANVPNNEVATISIFAQAYDDVAPYRFLDKVICQWRRKEYEVRKECGLDPVQVQYPGCFPLIRERDRERNLRTKKHDDQYHQSSFLKTVQDVILYNDQHRNNPNHTNVKIHMEDSNFEPAEEKNWDAWILEQSSTMNKDEALYHTMRHKYHGGNHTEALHHQYRKLIQGEELEWFNYWPMLGVKTEYYFRYSGSQTIPPCYGNRIDNSREGTNHWRVMKDPIRIHTRQLHELQRLTAERIAPTDSAINACQPDTAAHVTRDDVSSEEDDPTTTTTTTTTKIVDVNNARPLQAWAKSHHKTFCECKDWESKFPEDRNWCKIKDIKERFYEKPYNFGW